MELKKATFAAGCFWGVEAAFRHIQGVASTAVGYCGGHTENPTYKKVCTGATGHAEAVLVEFDPAQVSYAELLDAFWTCHDPTTPNRQGPDVGTQYRSVIFYHDEEQKKLAIASMNEVEGTKVFRRKIVTEIAPAMTFYPAEDYHQQYFEKQGMGQSCHVGPAQVRTTFAAQAAEERRSSCASACGTDHWKSLSEEELRARLTPEQYKIARQAGTEAPFTGKYWDEHEEGVYRCAVCGQELFDSKTKFDSGTGWPSFFQPISPGAVTERRDVSHGMARTEVVCSRCQSHLGHVFDDGPRPTRKRYCMNSAVLDLKTAGPHS